MRGNRRTGTAPERRVRSALHAKGLRFRVDYPIRAGGVLVRPDIVFTRQRLAVFVDGCFWHGCPEHGNMPRSNTDYWEAKLRRNQERDRIVGAALVAAGWSVVRIWEHVPVEDAAQTVDASLSSRRAMRP